MDVFVRVCNGSFFELLLMGNKISDCKSMSQITQIIDGQIKLTFSPYEGESKTVTFAVKDPEFWQGGVFGYFDKYGWLFVPYDKIIYVKGIRINRSAE